MAHTHTLLYPFDFECFLKTVFFHIWLYPLLLLLLLVYEMKRVKHSRGINTLTLFLSPSYFEIPRHKSIYFKSLCIIDFIIQYQKLIHLYNGVWMFEFLALSWFSGVLFFFTYFFSSPSLFLFIALTFYWYFEIQSSLSLKLEFNFNENGFDSGAACEFSSTTLFLLRTYMI